MFEAVDVAARRASRSARRCSSCSTTCTGPTARRSPCCCHLAAQPEAAPLLVLGTYRIGEVVGDHPLARDDHRAAPRPQIVDEITLTGLDERRGRRAVADIVHVDARRPDSCGACRRETEGNPFFVQEICSHVAEHRHHAASFTLDALGVPEGVKQVIGQRVAQLDERTGSLLSAAAVIGREFDLDLLLDVTGIDEDDALDLLDQACAARVVEEVARRRRALLVRARAHPRGALRLDERDPPGAPAPPGRGGHRDAAHADDLDDHLAALAYHYAAAGDATSTRRSSTPAAPASRR